MRDFKNLGKFYISETPRKSIFKDIKNFDRCNFQQRIIQETKLNVFVCSKLKP